MRPYTTYAFIHSLNQGKMVSTEEDEITILEELENGQYKAEYNGIHCTAIFNPFNGCFYADDVYGRIDQ